MREARLNTYSRCRDMLVVALQYKLTDEIRHDFLRCQIGAGFLFGPEVVEFLREAREQMHAIDVFGPSNNSATSSEQQDKDLAKYHAALGRSAAMLKEIDVVFGPYLDFKALK